jgi:hypothetical protein
MMGFAARMPEQTEICLELRFNLETVLADHYANDYRIINKD